MKSISSYLCKNQYLINLFFIAFIVLTLFSGFKTRFTFKSLEIKPFALVELFTSEGCSSCPPADKLLTELVNQSVKNDLNLFALSFHVSYWDYLGWKDPFAADAFTNRQRRYAKKLGSGVYTPQMIVNGSSEFVGSNKNAAATSVNEALTNSSSSIKFNKVNIQKNQSKIFTTFSLSGEIKNKIANIALVERDLNVSVSRGENRGRKLHHDNVVKQFKSLSVSRGSEFSVEMSIPKNVDLEKSSVIIYLQDLDTFRIYDAYGSQL